MCSETAPLQIPAVVSNVSRAKSDNGAFADTRNMRTVCQGSKYDVPVLLNINARSLSNEKLDELQAVSEAHRADILCITETWFTQYVSDDSVSLDDYVCERTDRTDGRGGGVACYIKNNLSYVRLHDLEKDSFEVCWLKLEPKRLPLCSLR